MANKDHESTIRHGNGLSGQGKAERAYGSQTRRLRTGRVIS